MLGASYFHAELMEVTAYVVKMWPRSQWAPHTRLVAPNDEEVEEVIDEGQGGHATVEEGSEEEDAAMVANLLGEGRLQPAGEVSKPPPLPSPFPASLWAIFYLS